jgi:pyruvate formate lyase activating enzyme
MKEALFYEKREESKVRCALCHHRCLIDNGKRGICGVRENRDGTLYTLVYGTVISGNVDPIEKKPLFHFMPGSRSFSIATVGCNFRCLHCQNADISQMPREQEQIVGHKASPEEIVSRAKETGCQSISYTYTEPTVFLEYALDTAKLAEKQGIKNTFVTNGYITPEALRTVSPHLHGANIDLKAMSEDFYRRVCGAKLQPILETITLYKELGIWIELTTLIIPNHNDSEEEITKIAAFIRSVDPGIPWHVTAFHPTYKLKDQPRTPVEILRKAREIGLKEGLHYVYEGNVPGEGGESTYCYNCGKLVIRRVGYSILKNEALNGKCPHCTTPIDGIGL